MLIDDLCMHSNDNFDNVVFELYKLCEVVLPEKDTWSIEEIFKHLYPNSQLQKTGKTFEELKEILIELSERQIIILVDKGYDRFKLLKQKLSAMVTSQTKLGNNDTKIRT
jgi:hypothetical protein